MCWAGVGVYKAGDEEADVPSICLNIDPQVSCVVGMII